MRKFFIFVVVAASVGGLWVPLTATAATKTAAKKVTAKVVKPVPKPAPVKLVPRRLDGVYVAPWDANKWPVAVMIDNHTDARPQSGLSQASVVYESLAEGGIPRFMAVYANYFGVGTIGPIRSTRPYFVRYAAEYSAALVHAGGSPDGLALLRKLRLVNIEGIVGQFARLFFRAYGGGVHGLYITGGKVVSAIASVRYDKLRPMYPSWKFVDEAVLAKRGPDGRGITIDLGAGRSYQVKYVYDRKKNVYLRSTGGVAQKDRQTRQQIGVKNVIMLVVPKEKILDKKGRLDIKNIGVDKGLLFQNGKVITVNWMKKSDKDRLRFKTPSGQEVSLVRGNTWITLVPRGHTYKLF